MSKDYKKGSRAAKVAPWIIGAAAMLVEGCATLSQPSPLGTATMAVATGGEDPPGDGDPGEPNGKGIYTLEGGNYCLEVLPQLHFCPETFVKAPTGVKLEGRTKENPKQTVSVDVGATVRGNPVKLIDLGSGSGRTQNPTQLTVSYTYGDPPKSATAQGESLLAVKLWFSARPLSEQAVETRFEMSFIKASNTPDATGIYRYAIQFQRNNDLPLDHCGGDAVSFLHERKIDGLNASVIDNASDKVTMACERGAIVMCQTWGYKPWEPSVKLPQETLGEAFGACLQAKRAAYFVGQGNLTGYTKGGILINKKDKYDIFTDSMVKLEAIWNKKGALCLNPGNRRYPAIVQPPAPIGFPTCDSIVINWNEVILATGVPPN